MSVLFTPVYFNKCLINLLFNLDHDYMLISSILQVQQVFDVKSRMPPSLCSLYRNKHICRVVFDL